MTTAPSSQPTLHECPKGRGDLAWEECCGHLYITKTNHYVRTLHVSGGFPDGLHLDVRLDYMSGAKRGAAGLNLSWEQVDELLAHIAEIRRRDGA